jgi:hypothetical protein
MIVLRYFAFGECNVERPSDSTLVQEIDEHRATTRRWYPIGVRPPFGLWFRTRDGRS